MEIWKRNLEKLKKKNPRIAAELEELILQNHNGSVCVEKLNDHVSILSVKRAEQNWRLNSRLDPQTASELYVKRCRINPFCRYFIFGFSDGRIVRNLLEACDESNIIVVYEPDKEILAKAVMQYDLVDLFSDQRLWIGIPETYDELAKVIAYFIEFSYTSLVRFYILPAYDLLYSEQCKRYINEVSQRIHYEIVEMRTRENFAREFAVNGMFHMKNMVQQRNCVQIKNELAKIGIDGVPAVIVAAGPSLDKNIHWLKRMQGRAFIFVVDAALRAVIREGITPDLVCTIDSRVPDRFFETIGEQNFLWACSYWTKMKIMKMYGGKVFYYNSLMPWWDKALQKEVSDPIPRMESGGSVSTEAFQLARYFGFDTIIFVGQDLAFTGGQSHTKGIGDILGGNDAYLNRRMVVQVEDINGDLLDTDFQMDYYRRWIEKQIEQDQTGLRVIDATEGGAKIKGTVVQSLKDTIEQECKQKVDIRKNLEEIPPIFNQEQRNRLYQKMDELEGLMEEFRRLLEEGILLEEDLKNEYLHLENSQVAERLRSIMEQNQKIEQHSFIGWVTFYTSKEERELKEKICAKEDMDIPEMMERSIRLMKAYQAALPLFEEDFNEIIRK